MRMWKYAVTTLIMIGTLVAGGVFFASAQEQDLNQTPVLGAEMAVDPRSSALSILEQIQVTLSEATLSNLGSEELKNVSAYVINLLEGEQGSNFVPLDGFEADPHGLIPYLQDVTNRDISGLNDEELSAMIRANTEPSDVLAMAHVHVAHSTLTSGDVDQSVLEAVAGHIKEAYALLQG